MQNNQTIIFPREVREVAILVSILSGIFLQWNIFLCDSVDVVLQQEEHPELKRGGVSDDFSDQVKVINEEGMPIYQWPFMRGELYIHFSVDFSLPPELYKA
ncbi:dnaJ protein [Cinnamomum micranthum f. kanehirae]|uniref:DnaJ protein n=1 Tax=Cinnamomum micranthum f. kanehirae TaxID=337451 RepID=A0A3S3MDM7_9MAGN|nr:dnaJ protein [Cinnamomum micranthum f. kanehirae]